MKTPRDADLSSFAFLSASLSVPTLREGEAPMRWQNQTIIQYPDYEDLPPALEFLLEEVALAEKPLR